MGSVLCLFLMHICNSYVLYGQHATLKDWAFACHSVTSLLSLTCF